MTCSRFSGVSCSGVTPIRSNSRLMASKATAEDVLSLALFPQVAPKFLAWRDGPHEAPAQPAEAPKAPPADPNAVRELFVEYKF